MTAPYPYSYGTTLLPHHQALLAASAIAPEVAQARGYESVTRSDRQRLRELGFSDAQARPGLLIPLWGVTGERVGYQLRPDEPRHDRRGRPIKYESPRGQRNALDVPPTVREALHKGRQAILITEGARKADALASLGIPCISLAGVYGWRGQNDDGGATALPDWEDIAIKGAVFMLAFDSDILTKPEVHTALTRLRRFLEGRGAARVRVLVLPPSLDGKTGVDDYIARAGITSPDQLAPLVVDDLPTPPGPEARQDDGPPPDLAPLLDTLAATFRSYIVCTAEQAHTWALWVAHTHAFTAAETTPYISIRSAEKRSGKSLTLELTEHYVPQPLMAANISVAALAHTVADGCTLLLDEVDSIFRRGPSSETQEALQGILDSGYRRSGSYVRMVGQGANMVPHRFPTFGPKMLAGIGALPGTLDDRCIVFTLHRRRKSEPVRAFRYREVSEEAAPVREALARWARHAVPSLAAARPSIPDTLSDRAADVWEPLLAIADMAGGEWPQRARAAAITLSGGDARDDESTGVRLLADLVEPLSAGRPRPTLELLAHLNGLEESPWATWNGGRGMRPQDLARALRPFGIRPRTVRLPDTQTAKGYHPDDFRDALERYLPSGARPEHVAVTSGHSAVTPSPPYASDVGEAPPPPKKRKLIVLG